MEEIKTKVCTKCKIEKDITSFFLRKERKLGYRSECKKCTNIKKKQLRKSPIPKEGYRFCSRCKQELLLSNFFIRNKLKKLYVSYCKSCSHDRYIETKDKYKETRKNYLNKNQDKLKKYRKNYKENFEKNHTLTYKEYVNTKAKKYRDNNKDKVKIINKKCSNKRRLLGLIAKYYRDRKKNNQNYRILCNLRRRIKYALYNKNKSESTMNLIGCSIEQLKTHLQQTTIDNGYLDFNIENYSGIDYHIDHIIPCCAFNLECSYHQKLCFNWNNTRILKAQDNLSKISDDIKLKKLFINMPII